MQAARQSRLGAPGEGSAMDMSSRIKRLQAVPGVNLVMALGLVIAVLFQVSVVGYYAVDDDRGGGSRLTAAQPGFEQGETTGDTVPGETTTTVAGGDTTSATLPGGAP